jgi:hypothetical protein
MTKLDSESTHQTFRRSIRPSHTADRQQIRAAALLPCFRANTEPHGCRTDRQVAETLQGATVPLRQAFRDVNCIEEFCRYSSGGPCGRIHASSDEAGARYHPIGGIDCLSIKCSGCLPYRGVTFVALHGSQLESVSRIPSTGSATPACYGGAAIAGTIFDHA